ncbi:MAG: hypothetical protein R3F60_19590 [bacterium]
MRWLWGGLLAWGLVACDDQAGSEAQAGADMARARGSVDVGVRPLADGGGPPGQDAGDPPADAGAPTGDMAVAMGCTDEACGEGRVCVGGDRCVEGTRCGPGGDCPAGRRCVGEICLADPRPLAGWRPSPTCWRSPSPR